MSRPDMTSGVDGRARSLTLPADIEHAIVRLANTGLGSPQLRILIFEYIQAAIQKGGTER